MKHLVFLFTLISSATSAQVNVPIETATIQIAYITPNIIKSYRLNKETNKFENYILEDQSSIINKIKIDTTRIKKNTTLSNTNKESLISILKNKFEWNDEEEQIVIECYNPKHFISFLNKKGELIGGLEICIECKGNRTFLIGDNTEAYLAEEHYQYLKELFEKIEMDQN